MIVNPGSLGRQENAKVTGIVCENVPMQENVSLPVTSLLQGVPSSVIRRGGNGELSTPVRYMCVTPGCCSLRRNSDIRVVRGDSADKQSPASRLGSMLTGIHAPMWLGLSWWAVCSCSSQASAGFDSITGS